MRCNSQIGLVPLYPSIILRERPGSDRVQPILPADRESPMIDRYSRQNTARRLRPLQLSSLIFLIAATSSASWGAETIECNNAGTQLELNACALDEFKQADQALNETYAALMKKESKDPTFVRKLRAAQRAWIAFRDAEIDSTYACNEKDARVCWGSMLPLSVSAYKTKLTRERTARLLRILDEGRPAD